MTIEIVIIWALVFVVLLVAFKLWPSKIKIDQKALALAEITNNYPEFTVSSYFLRFGVEEPNLTKVHGIAVDKKAEKFCLISAGKPRLYVYNDLIESQLEVQGQLIASSKVNRLVKFIGTPVADIIVEAYGRFGGPKIEPVRFAGIPLYTPQHKVPVKRNFLGFKIKPVDYRVNLRVIVRDINRPFHVFPFVEAPNPDDEIFKSALQEGEAWAELMSKVAKKADEDIPEVDLNRLCIADELTKLLALKAEGALSDDEFMTVKNRLVNEPS